MLDDDGCLQEGLDGVSSRPHEGSHMCYAASAMMTVVDFRFRRWNDLAGYFKLQFCA